MPEGVSVLAQLFTAATIIGVGWSSAATDITTIVVPGRLGTVAEDYVNASVQFLLQYDFPRLSDGLALRAFASSPDLAASQFNPLLIVVKHEQGVLSWQIPFLSPTDSDGDGRHERLSPYYAVNRTLCPTSAPVVATVDLHRSALLTQTFDRVIIEVSTSSTVNVLFNVALDVQRSPPFRIGIGNVSHQVTFGPSEPYVFELDLGSANSSLLTLTSHDSLCMIMSVQNRTCPVSDLPRSVYFSGAFQTVDRRGAMTVSRDRFPFGAFAVFAVKPDDADCSGRPTHGARAQHRNKTIRFQLRSQITRQDYVAATLAAFFIFLGAYGFVIFVSCLWCIRTRNVGGGSGGSLQPAAADDERRVLLTADFAVGSNSNYGAINNTVNNEVTDSLVDVMESESGSPSTSIDVIGVRDPRRRQQREEPENLPADDERVDEDSTVDEDEIDFVRDADDEKDVFRTKTFLYVSDLARKHPRTLAKKSQLYYWNLWTVSIFYGLPVVQLCWTYQKMTDTTGNEDLCYYNFLCAHRLGVIADFNHVYSNIGYIMLGLLFMGVSWRREILHNRAVRLEPDRIRRLGVPKHFGLYYAMGLALIMEGIMSGCYHVCPNRTNFQFDTAFMYTIAILILCKIYQSRHPDINANAYTAFGVLAFIIFIGVIGILNGSYVFWSVFVAAYVTASLVLSIQIYYMGRWRINPGIFRRMWLVVVNDSRCVMSGNWRGLKPMYGDRMVLLLILNAVNWGLAAFGMTNLAVNGTHFATFLLGILMSNVILYTLFYICMKLRHGERLKCQTIIYFVLSIAFVCGAGYFFTNNSTNSDLSPAESRDVNQNCRLFRFYDNHDIWHFLSAFWLFLSFMILLTWDDDLETVPREKIPVF